MDKHAKLLKKIRHGNTDIRFEDLKGLCEFYFGPCRQSGSSHAVFKMLWKGGFPNEDIALYIPGGVVS
jgi:hypothetical protein